MNRKLLVVSRLQAMSNGKIFLPLVVIHFAYVSALADDATQASENPPPAIVFRLLRQRTVETDGQAVVLNRVAPPVLPQEPIALPSKQEISASENAILEQPAKKSSLLFLSATVYDHKVTAIGLLGGSGRAGIFSNIDFNLLEGVGSIETDDTLYTLMLALSNQTADDALAHNHELAGQGASMAWDRIPSSEEFSTTRSECIVAEDAAHQAPTGEELAALNALHVFFDANRQQIAKAKLQRETARADAQRQLAEHPPAPPDIVIHYWKNDPAPMPSRP